MFVDVHALDGHLLLQMVYWILHCKQYFNFK